jgi:monoamine oxidase
MQDRFDVAVVGAGAAGIAALRRLAAAGLSVVGLEARDRVGGRAHTVRLRPDLPVDCGAGWVHSADQNLLAQPIEQAGFTLDRSPPHWMRQALNQGFSAADQRAFRDALNALEDRLEAAAATGVDRPGSDFFEPGGRWNVMLDAFSSFYNGAEFDQVSTLDFAAYEDSGVNWRVREGYGALIAAHGAELPVRLGSPVRLVDHGGRAIRVETARGDVRVRAVLVTLPPTLLADETVRFVPALPPAKRAAAQGLPLGLANKLFLALDGAPPDVPPDGHLVGALDRVATGSYQFRPFGRPLIAAFFGGALALDLERGGTRAMEDFAAAELAGLFGSGFRRKLRPLASSAWASDPFARGSYSFALPGHAGDRAILAAPLDDRLFFAGEACSAEHFSTAHGAFLSGREAAERITAALNRPNPR